LGWCEARIRGSKTASDNVMKSSTDITELLIDWGAGNRDALDELIPLVEKELHRMAHRNDENLGVAQTQVAFDLGGLPN